MPSAEIVAWLLAVAAILTHTAADAVGDRSVSQSLRDEASIRKHYFAGRAPHFEGGLVLFGISRVLRKHRRDRESSPSESTPTGANSSS